MRRTIQTDTRVLASLLMLGLLSFVSCSPREKGPSGAHSTLPRGTMDAPPLGRQATLQGNSAQLLGWATGDGGVSEVAVYIDRIYLTSAKIGLPRPDVARAFPEDASAKKAGWQAALNLSQIAPGPHELVVQATGVNGAKRDLGVIPIVVAR